MSSVQLASGGFGGVIQGNFGTYTQSSDGTFTVDPRDVPPLLARGFSYVKMTSTGYTLPKAPAAATAGAIIASGALSNGSLSIAASPDVTRPVQFEFATGSAAITAGKLTVVYVANDGALYSEEISLVAGANTTKTVKLSRGVTAISSAIVSGLVGGSSPWRRMNTLTSISLPVAPNSVDFAVSREYDAGATIAVGTVLTDVLGSITPTTAPNGTVTYSFTYQYVSPVT